MHECIVCMYRLGMFSPTVNKYRCTMDPEGCVQQL